MIAFRLQNSNKYLEYASFSLKIFNTRDWSRRGQLLRLPDDAEVKATNRLSKQSIGSLVAPVLR